MKKENAVPAITKTEYDKKITAVCFTAAVLLIASCAVFYFFCAGSGIHVYDERAYISIAHRFVLGDRPVADDWSTAMLLSFFLSIPVRLFCAVTGSTEGIVLFCRYLYIAVSAVFSFGLFCALRKHRFAAVAAALLYMCYVPLEMYSLNYNPISMMAVITVCLLLFTGSAPGRVRLFVSGVIFAAAVVSLPPLAVMYFVYSLYIAVRAIAAKKKKSDIAAPYETPAGWLFITLGIAANALVFMIYILCRMSVNEIIVSVSGILTQIGTSYHSNFSLERLAGIVNTLGAVQCILGIVLLIAAALDKEAKKRRLLYFILGAADGIAMYVSIYLTFYGVNGDTPKDIYAVLMRTVPLAFAGLLAYELTGKKDRRTFSFFVLCMLYAVVRDLSSNIIFGLGSVAANIASVLLIRSLASECFAEKKENGKGKSAQRIAACLCLLPVAAALCCETVWKVAEYDYRVVESTFMRTDEKLTSEIESGPLKGIKTSLRVKLIIGNMTRDLDAIKSKYGDKIYVAGAQQWTYLYLEDSYTACSAMFNEHNIELSQMTYWELHPDRKPDCVYIPWYDPESYLSVRQGAERVKELFGSLCSFDIEEGASGYILYNLEWN